MTEYKMEIGFNNRTEGFIFPVLPETLELKRKGRGKSYDVVGIGQVNVIHSRELAEISFQSVFPAGKFPYNNPVRLKYDSPSQYVDNLCKWQDSRRPCRFIFNGPQFPINLPVSIEQFDRWEEGGSPGDIHFRLTLKEYVFHAPKKAGAPEDAKGAARPDERIRPDTYTMRSGDTLIGIARKLYGSSEKWRDIQALNAIPDAKLRSLPVGLVLRLPKE